MYENDSFFTLTMIERIGLVGVTLVLCVLTIGLFHTFTRKCLWYVRIMAALGFLYLFIWLSPQAYYTYYLQIFDFLEHKNVIQPPPHPLIIVKLLTFTESGRLSHHGQGLLGWVMILMAILQVRKNSLKIEAE